MLLSIRILKLSRSSWGDFFFLYPAFTTGHPALWQHGLYMYLSTHRAPRRGGESEKSLLRAERSMRYFLEWCSDISAYWTDTKPKLLHVAAQHTPGVKVEARTGLICQTLVRLWKRKMSHLRGEPHRKSSTNCKLWKRRCENLSFTSSSYPKGKFLCNTKAARRAARRLAYPYFEEA